MEFYKWCEQVYNEIIERSRNRNLSGYFEKHHVMPKSIYPELKNDKDNIVKLTGREHFLCHWLLYLIYKYENDLVNRDKMAAAWFRIAYPTKNRQITSREYELAKIAFVESERGTFYWNNGKENLISRECPGPEWKRGRVDKGKRTWWNNGEKAVVSSECPGEGWTKGMLKDFCDKIWWTNGKTEMKSKKCPGEGWTKGRITVNELWWTNGEIDVKSKESPGSQWRRGRSNYVEKDHNCHKTILSKSIWNNGEINVASVECPGEGWTKGRVKKELHFWNNGEISIKAKECPGPEWEPGRLMNSKHWWTNEIENLISENSPGEGWRRGRII